LMHTDYRAAAQSHRPGLWMDFSDGRLLLYDAIVDDPSDSRGLPFDVILRRDHLGPKEIRRALTSSGRGHGADQLHLKDFHRFLILMAGEEQILTLLWRCFFQTCESEIRQVWDGGTAAAVVPTAWTPQIASALAAGFEAVFGHPPNICTTAAAAPFSALTAMQALVPNWPIGHRQRVEVHLAENQHTQSGATYVYHLLKKQPNQLCVDLVGWHSNSLKAMPGDKGEITRHNLTCGRHAYYSMLDWLDQPDRPRVDLTMDLSLGIITAEGRYLPIRTPCDPACHWVGRRLRQTRGRRVTLSLAARPGEDENGDENFFPMTCITTDIAAHNQIDIEVMLRPINYSSVAIRILAGTDRIETQARLPRLFQ
jgi:hypothetical protein